MTRAHTRAVRLAYVTWLLLVLGGWSADHARATGARSGGARATASATVEVEPDAPAPPGHPVDARPGEVRRPERSLDAGLDPAPPGAILAVHFRASGRDTCSGTALPPPPCR